jgi:hypothetical protein
MLPQIEIKHVGKGRAARVVGTANQRALRVGDKPHNVTTRHMVRGGIRFHQLL